MGGRMRRRQQEAAAFLIAFGLCGGIGTRAFAANRSADGFATVHARSVVQSLSAYGQIKPIAIVKIRAVNPGTLHSLRVVPGSVVTAGERLARIGGPRMQTLLTTAEQSLRGAQAREHAARRNLGITQHLQTVQLATQQQVDTAQSNLVSAHTAVQTADARLREIRSQQNVRAPSAGTVIAVQAADGEQTAAGETLLTLQPAGKLWIRASYYGADSALLRVGMTGRFRPAAGIKVIAVKVVAISAGLAADAGLRVGLVSTSSVLPGWWVTGQWGTVTLDGPSRQMVTVPTSALILDRGRWWVLLHTPHGDKPRQVVPGSAQGWRTQIASGLEPGQQIVVRDAFLDYHRGIAQSYQSPD